jgi:hypothetical protein
MPSNTKAPQLWGDATATPKAQWSDMGALTKMYKPCKELLQRLQKAYQAAYQGKRPNLGEIATYAICVAARLLTKEAERLEQIAADREELALAAKGESTKIVILTPVNADDNE